MLLYQKKKKNSQKRPSLSHSLIYHEWLLLLRRWVELEVFTWQSISVHHINSISCEYVHCAKANLTVTDSNLSVTTFFCLFVKSLETLLLPARNTLHYCFVGYAAKSGSFGPYFLFKWVGKNSLGQVVIISSNRAVSTYKKFGCIPINLALPSSEWYDLDWVA